MHSKCTAPGAGGSAGPVGLTETTAGTGKDALGMQGTQNSKGAGKVGNGERSLAGAGQIPDQSEKSTLCALANQNERRETGPPANRNAACRSLRRGPHPVSESPVPCSAGPEPSPVVASGAAGGVLSPSPPPPPPVAAIFRSNSILARFPG